jgi:hypothetical protein
MPFWGVGRVESTNVRVVTPTTVLVTLASAELASSLPGFVASEDPPSPSVAAASELDES